MEGFIQVNKYLGPGIYMCIYVINTHIHIHTHRHIHIARGPTLGYLEDQRYCLCIVDATCHRASYLR